MLVGVCIGFLPHNFYPARIFMGDSGSMLIGLLLAASTITLTGQVDSESPVSSQNLVPALLPLLLPLAVLAVPLVDLLLAVVRRTRAGRSPFAPDKQHLHHRLLEIGHSQRRAVLIMYVWSALIAFGAVGLARRCRCPSRWRLVVVGLVVRWSSSVAPAALAARSEAPSDARAAWVMADALVLRAPVRGCEDAVRVQSTHGRWTRQDPVSSAENVHRSVVRRPAERCSTREERGR